MARALAVVIWLITLFGVALFSGRFGWFPETISEFGAAIDAQFIRTLVVVGIAFVLSQVGLGYYVWRYRGSRSGEAIRQVGERFRQSGGASIADAAELIRLSGL